jgi:hypothetical protein
MGTSAHAGFTRPERPARHRSLRDPPVFRQRAMCSTGPKAIDRRDMLDGRFHQQPKVGVIRRYKSLDRVPGPVTAAACPTEQRHLKARQVAQPRSDCHLCEPDRQYDSDDQQRIKIARRLLTAFSPVSARPAETPGKI